MTQPKKSFRAVGSLIGIAMWAALAYWAYPHWAWYLLGMLCGINIMDLGRVISRSRT